MKTFADKYAPQSFGDLIFPDSNTRQRLLGVRQQSAPQQFDFSWALRDRENNNSADH